jgi:hypothetical protein
LPKLNGFIGPAYTVQSTNINAQRCINLYPQLDESGTGKNVASLLNRPGLTPLLNIGSVARGSYLTVETGRQFFVENVNFWEAFADGTKTLRGTLTSSAGFVGMADNGLQIMLVDGPGGYSYDLTTNVLTQIPDFPGGATVTYQDGYFIFNQPNTQKFWITELNGTSVDPLDFSSADGAPDDLLLALSDHRSLWLAGPSSIEVWYNSGDELFPFARDQSGFIPHGIVSAQCMFKADNTLAWVGQDDQGKGMIWRAVGYQPQRISTYAIEQEIAKYPTLADCVGFSYQQDGHTFGVWNFPSGNKTWVYDFSTQLWSEWAYTGTFGLERARPEMHTRAFGKHVVTDYSNGNVYVLDPTALNDNGTVITKLRAAPYVSDELKNLFIAFLQIDMETGNTTIEEGGVEPVAMLDWSDDGGHTWSNSYMSGLGFAGIGLIGQYSKRVIWRRLGRTRQRIFRVTITDDIKVAMIDAFIRVEEGIS